MADIYLVTPLSSKSGGTTTIWYEEIPVWMMQYAGQYDEKAIPCLRAALRAAYEEMKFFGGRGPKNFVHEGLTYENRVHPSFRSDFQNSDYFKGYENIWDESRKSLGWHSYQGMPMI